MILRIVAVGVSFWLMPGQMIFFLKIARGEPAGLADLFGGGRYVLKIFLAYLIFVAAFMVGALLLVVPGIIVGLTLSQTFYLLLDRNVGVFEAMSLSRQATNGNKFSMFLFALASFGFTMLVVVFTLCLGLFVFAPYIMLCWAVMYLMMTGQRTADQIDEGLEIGG